MNAGHSHMYKHLTDITSVKRNLTTKGIGKVCVPPGTRQSNNGLWVPRACCCRNALSWSKQGP
eukprot:5665563-Amphidinium_carterae.2